MDLLGKMVGAPGPSAAALAETRTDAELIADIAPAMLIKLRADGTAKGAEWGSTLNLLWMCWFLGDLAVRNLQPTADRLGPWSYFLWGLSVTAALQIALPFFFKRRSVLNEVRYRRQHGKWRWEH
jgi:hypothetical protein